MERDSNVTFMIGKTPIHASGGLDHGQKLVGIDVEKMKNPVLIFFFKF